MKGGGGGRSHHVSRKNQSDDCDDINVKTTLLDSQLEISEYKNGDILQLSINNNNGLCVYDDSAYCGIVNPPNTDKIINCINKGQKFKAVIIEISTDTCKLRIRPLNL